MNEDVLALKRGMAADRLAMNGDWLTFIEWVEEQMVYLVSQVMLTENSELENATLRGKYQSFNEVKSVLEHFANDADTVKEQNA